MYFILDTWLDNKTPSIRVVNKETGQSILEFKGKDVQQLLDQQIIDIEDLYYKNSDMENENINALFIYARQQSQILQAKLKSLMILCPHKRMNTDKLVSTFNRFEYLRKGFLAHKQLNIKSV